MNSDLIMKSDVLDIIFENRNKAYGAYDLRKFYQNRLYKSIGIMLLCVCLLFCLAFINTEKKVETVSFIETPTLREYHQVTAEVPKQKPAEKPAMKLSVSKPANKPAQQGGGNKIVYVKDSLKVISDHPMLAVTNINAAVAATSASDAGNISSGVTDGKPGGTGQSTATTTDVNMPMETADVYPSFPGGNEALKKFLEKNLKTPADMEDDVTISVQVEFVVGYDGKLKSFKVVKDGGDDFNNEVIRVLKKMPNWIPGKSSGHNVSVYHIIPVKFVSSDVNP
jgi:protein TonB